MFSLRGDVHVSPTIARDTRRYDCKKCENRRRHLTRKLTPKYRQQSRACQKRLKKKLLELSNKAKSGGCIVCGYNKTPSAMDFHHLGDKDRNVSSCKSVKQLQEEIAKCVVLCANCHRELHAGAIEISFPPPTMIQAPFLAPDGPPLTPTSKK